MTYKGIQAINLKRSAVEDHGGIEGVGKTDEGSTTDAVVEVTAKGKGVVAEELVGIADVHAGLVISASSPASMSVGERISFRHAHSD